MDLQATYNKIAEDFFKDHLKDDWWIEGTNRLISFLPKGASVLDVGCGQGLKANYLKTCGFKVLGVDFSEKMIEIGKREFPDVEFRLLNVYELDTLKKKFDCVFAQAVLLHIPKKRVGEVLEKFRRRLKPGGLLYVAVKELKDGAEEKIEKESDYGYEYERFFSYFSLRELREDFRRCGFKIIFETTTSSGHSRWLQLIGREKAA